MDLGKIFDVVLQLISSEKLKSFCFSHGSYLHIGLAELLFHDLFEYGQRMLDGFFQSHSFVKHLLQTLLSTFVARSDGLGIISDVGARRIHMEQLGSMIRIAHSNSCFALTSRKRQL